MKAMKHVPWIHSSIASVLAVGLVAFAFASSAVAEPEIGPPPGPPPQDGPRPPHGPHHPPHDPLRRALDADGDHVISSEEIANAATALETLDKNGDGKLDREEMRPSMPPGMEHRRGDRGRGPGAGPGPERDRRGPPPDGDRSEGRGAFREHDGPWPPMPSPERLVERMMEFDADEDGKLDRAELTAAAGRMAERMAERRREFVERMGRPRGPERDGP